MIALLLHCLLPYLLVGPLICLRQLQLPVHRLVCLTLELYAESVVFPGRDQQQHVSHSGGHALALHDGGFQGGPGSTVRNGEEVQRQLGILTPEPEDAGLLDL